MKATAFCLSVTLFFGLCVQAQQIIPNSLSAAAHSQAQPDPLPSAYTAGMPLNYVRSFVATKPTTDPNQITITSAATDVQIQTAYVDGLGRPLQTVSKGSSPLEKDIVAPVAYDAFGRESYKYQPYTASTSDGAFKTTPFADQASFLQSQYSTQQELFFYGKTDFEASPLNRPLKTMAPGNSWAGSGRGVEISYEINEANEVRIWNIDLASGAVPASTAYYNAGELYRTVTKDENAKRVVEYKDKEGRVVLKKVEIGVTPPAVTASTGWLSTYYVYDDLGQLRYVLSPKATEQVLGTGTISTDIDKELCFRYEYDTRGRMILKKVPGAGEVLMVYDARDRLVFTQDGKLKDNNQNRWLVTLYDDLNRPVATGMMTYSGTVQQLRDYAADIAHLSGVSNISVQGATKQLSLVVPARIAGESLYEASQSVEFTDGFESETTADFVAQINTGAAPATTQTATGSPIPSEATYTLLTQTFYDDYTKTQKVYSATNNAKLDAGTSLYPEALPSARSTATKGMVTSTKVWVMEDASDLSKGRWLETATFYDEKGRVIQVQTDNVRGGMETVTSRYDFSGKVITTYQVHKNPAGKVGETSTRTNTEYDNAGRLLSVKKTINDAATAKLVVQNLYDEQGQLLTKKLGTKPGSTDPLETLTYAYNIRGWLGSINKDYVTKASDNNYFGQTLSYDYGFSSKDATNNLTEKAEFNGNIAGVQWRSKGDGEQRAYGFAYDAANRLLKADFTQNNSGWNTSAKVDFSVQMGDGADPFSAYDANGNIKEMWQSGLTISGAEIKSDWIDKLKYTYYLNGNSNKLRNVIDLKNDPTTRLGDFRTSELHPQKGLKQTYAANQASVDPNTITDYGYDVNGNLVSDLNKNMSGTTGTDISTGGAITYNHLNLPFRISVKNDDGTDKGTITYIYDAAGNKLQKIVDELAHGSTPAKSVTTTYINGFVYEKVANEDELQFFSHEEGRTRPLKDANGAIAGYAYDYFLKDHLGNIRMVLTDEVKPTGVYQATMETAANGVETQLFANIPETRVDKPANNEFDADNTNQKVSLLYSATASDKRVGPYVVLKVMAGDRFKARVYGWYKAGQTDVAQETGVGSIISSLVSAFTGTAPLASESGTQVSSSGVLNTPLNNFLSSQPTPASGVPKAYLNYLVLDETQLKLVDGNYNSIPMPVIANGVQKQLIQASNGGEIEVKKNGYLFVYLSNESKGNVYFDDLRVEHIKGAVQEETHYYPFGLVQQGISSNALSFGQSTNKKKFNGIEQNTAFDLNMYDAKYRNLDPQLGRFWQVDPKVESAEAWSPYSAMLNNPIRYADPLGDSTIKPVAFIKPSFEVRQPKKENASFISLTLALTEGTYGVHGKVLDVGIESVGSGDEKDIIAVRDNKSVFDGHVDGEAEVTTRDGYSGSIGGFGGSDVTETKKLDGTIVDTKRAETITSPFVSATKTTDKDGKVTNTHSTQIFGFKAGFHYGVEVGVQINWPTFSNSANVPATHRDNLVPQRLFIPLSEKKK